MRMKIKSILQENWRGKLLWLFHWKDDWETHQKRYYNLKSVKKLINDIDKYRTI